MTSRQQLYTLAVHACITLAAVTGAVVLGYHGTLDSQAVAAILAGALAISGGSAAAVGTLGTVVNGKSVVSAQQVSEQGATQRTAIIAAAAGDPHTVTPVEPTAPEAHE